MKLLILTPGNMLIATLMSTQGEQVDRTVEKTKVKIPTPMDQINLHVRGGYILPTQQPANSTVFRLVPKDRVKWKPLFEFVTN